MGFPPPFLPPRRPTSFPNLVTETSSWDPSSHNKHTPANTPPPFLPPRTPSLRTRKSVIGTQSQLATIPDGLLLHTGRFLNQHDQAEEPLHGDVVRSNSDRPRRKLSKPRRQDHAEQLVSPRLRAIQDDAALFPRPLPSTGRPSLRHSSLRIQRRLSEEDEGQIAPLPRILSPTYSEPHLRSDVARPYSLSLIHI